MIPKRKRKSPTGRSQLDGHRYEADRTFYISGRMLCTSLPFSSSSPSENKRGNRRWNEEREEKRIDIFPRGGNPDKSIASEEGNKRTASKCRKGKNAVFNNARDMDQNIYAFFNLLLF